jgi:hypothetical protein
MQNTITVNGITVKIAWYSEAKRTKLEQIRQEIDKWIDENPNARISDVKPELKAGWWMKKAMILWDAERPLTLDFFKSPDFEQGALEASEAFFLSKHLYL